MQQSEGRRKKTLLAMENGKKELDLKSSEAKENFAVPISL
jgi:hypothetical protein